MKFSLVSFVAIFVLSIFCFAQIPAPSAPAPVPGVSLPASPDVAAAPAPSSLDKVSSVVNKIPNAVPSVILAILAFLAELALRFYPTLKPRSLFLYAASLFSLISLGLSKISSLLDSVAQNVKDPAP